MCLIMFKDKAYRKNIASDLGFPQAFQINYRRKCGHKKYSKCKTQVKITLSIKTKQGGMKNYLSTCHKVLGFDIISDSLTTPTTNMAVG